MTNHSNSNTINSYAVEQAFTELYPDIKKIAQAQLNKLKPGKTITATVLVNECYLKLQNKSNLAMTSEKHFFCLIAKCMKQFLIDQIRGQNSSKRHAELVTNLVSQVMGTTNINTKLIEIVRAVDQLQIINGELAELVTLHCFGGFTFEELSKTLKLSKRQLIRKWNVAKSMIFTLLDENPEIS